MGRLAGPEIIIILVIVLLLFGAKKLPDLARSLGSSAKEFRKGVEGGMTDDEDDSGGNSADNNGASQGSADGTNQASPPSPDG